MPSPPQIKSAVGSEYILVVTAEGLLDRKLLYECTLCDEIERYCQINFHLSSNHHRMKFLETHFPRTHFLIRTRKHSSNENDLKGLLDIVVEEILRNIPQKPILEVEYLEYENNNEKVYEQASKSIGTYDNMLLFVTEMNYLLNRHFEPVDEYQEYYSSNVVSALVTEETQANENDEHPVIDLTNVDSDDAVPQKSAENLEDDKSKIKKLIEYSEGNFQADDQIQSIITTNEQEAAAAVSTITDVPAIATIPDVPAVAIIPVISDDAVELAFETPASTDASNSLELLRDEACISMYNEKIRKLEKEISNQYEAYLKDPSNHPNFIGEWKKYYLEKSYEISVQQKFSYTEAWKSHWSEFIENLKSQDLNKSESTLKRKLKMLPEDLAILSDISDDELEGLSPPKRAKHEEALRYLNTKPVEALTETDRMLIAYNIAYENFKNQKELSPDELVEKMKPYVVAKEPNVQLLDFNDNEISNVCLQNFNNLSPTEQANFLSVMQTMKLNEQQKSKFGNQV